MNEFKFADNALKNRSGKTLATVRNNYIYDATGKRVAHVQDNRIYSSDNRMIARLEGDRILATGGYNTLGTMSSVRKDIDTTDGDTLLAALFVLVCKK